MAYIRMTYEVMSEVVSWNGGNMYSAPGGRRARFTGIQDIEEEVWKAAHHWWTE